MPILRGQTAQKQHWRSEFNKKATGVLLGVIITGQAIKQVYKIRSNDYDRYSTSNRLYKL